MTACSRENQPTWLTVSLLWWRKISNNENFSLTQLNYLPLFRRSGLIICVIKSSMGCSEVIQMGRKSQFCSLAGKHFGMYTWSTVTVATNRIRKTTGTQIPTITFHPAMETANTRAGRSRKRRRRYKMANQRYLFKNKRTLILDGSSPEV